MRFNTTRLPLMAAAAAALALSACVDDGDSLITIPSGPGSELFARYVSMGNSITAGYQSSGLNRTLQAQAYPVLLAQRAGALNFTFPAVATPGCPVPFTAPLTANTKDAPSCVRTDTATFQNRVRNVAVPGARIADLLRIPAGNTGSLHLLLNGPQTQVGAMKAASPTFVSAWIGNNDALEATLGGVLGPLAAGADSSLTPLSQFNASLSAIVDSIASVNPQGAMLVGVVNAIQAAPLIQPGVFFYLSRDANGNFQGKPVNNNCAPVDLLGQPNPLAANFVSFQIVSSAVPQIDCSGTLAGGAFVLDASEQAIVTARVNAFNAAIKAAADAKGWLYVDPNTILNSFLPVKDAQNRYQRIRKCQELLAALQTGSAATIQSAVFRSCPVPPTPNTPTAPFAAPNLFGTLISFDGVHPSTEAHGVLADYFSAYINRKYGTTLATPITTLP